jgi:drug/metabolite transporter (DMT)-like permease
MGTPRDAGTGDRLPAPPPKRYLDLGAIALTLFMSSIWGGNTIAVKLGLEDAPPMRLAWMRFLLAGGSVFVWARISKAPLRVERGERYILAVIGVLFVIQIAMFNWGTYLTTAGHVGVLLNVYPVHVIVLAHFFVPDDRLTARRFFAVLAAYAGAVLVFVPQVHGIRATLLGDLIISASGVVLAVRTIILNRALRRVNQTKLLLDQVVLGVPAFFLLDLLTEGHIPTHYTGRLGLSLLYQGILSSGFNFIVNLWLLKQYQPSALAPFFLSTPIFGVLLSWWILGEPLTPYLFAGAILVAVGIGVGSLRGDLLRAGKARLRKTT